MKTLRLHDPAAFAADLVKARRKKGLSAAYVAKKLNDSLGVHPKHYLIIENGGTATIDFQIIDELMDIIPGFSPARVRGIDQPGTPIKDMRDVRNIKNIKI